MMILSFCNNPNPRRQKFEKKFCNEIHVGKWSRCTTAKLMILFFSRFFHDIGELHAVAEAAATEDSKNVFIIIR